MIVLFMKGNPAVTPMQLDVTRALVAEFLYTFALCYVVLNVATAKGTSGNSDLRTGDRFHGARRRVCGRRHLRRRVQSCGGRRRHDDGPASMANIWIFLVANFAGGAAAGVLFKVDQPAGSLTRRAASRASPLNAEPATNLAPVVTIYFSATSSLVFCQRIVSMTHSNLLRAAGAVALAALIFSVAPPRALPRRATPTSSSRPTPTRI